MKLLSASLRSSSEDNITILRNMGQWVDPDVSRKSPSKSVCLGAQEDHMSQKLNEFKQIKGRLKVIKAAQP